MQLSSDLLNESTTTIVSNAGMTNKGREVEASKVTGPVTGKTRTVNSESPIFLATTSVCSHQKDSILLDFIIFSHQA